MKVIPVNIVGGLVFYGNKSVEHCQVGAVIDIPDTSERVKELEEQRKRQDDYLIRLEARYTQLLKEKEQAETMVKVGKDMERYIETMTGKEFRRFELVKAALTGLVTLIPNRPTLAKDVIETANAVLAEMDKPVQL